MDWVDSVAIYWFLVKMLLITTAVLIAFSSFDDLFIDICFWCRRIYQRLTGASADETPSLDILRAAEERPIALMVPAWQEADVIAQMLHNALTVFDYQRYHIFVGTYPNDLDTQREVDSVAAAHPNIHKVVGARPGPTCKADCLNEVIASILEFEAKQGIEFAGFVLQDSEDVVHPLELRLFNAMIGRYDLVQIPVLPLPRPWKEFTGGHYKDEFTECHTKDVPVRAALTGIVPSAGVGTAFSRNAILALHRERDGEVFNPGSLTEDYDISLRLRELGMRQVFVRVRVPSDSKGPGHADEYIAVREYFPNSFRAAYRQKARWILGIALQGWANVGWKGNLATKYILFRDRKALVTSQVGFLAYFVVLNVVLMELVHLLLPDSYWFPQLVPVDSWLWWLMIINALLLSNRVLHRAIFMTHYYGWRQGLLSAPRQIWANVVNFFACNRALRQFAGHLLYGRHLGWDKTQHAFPVAPDMGRPRRRRLGELLLDLEAIASEQLHHVLAEQRSDPRPLGILLLDRGWLNEQTLKQALQMQEGYDKAA